MPTTFNFPNGIDDFQPTLINDITVVNADHINDLRAAIAAIENALIGITTLDYTGTTIIQDGDNIRRALEKLDQRLTQLFIETGIPMDGYGSSEDGYTGSRLDSLEEQLEAHRSSSGPVDSDGYTVHNVDGEVVGTNNIQVLTRKVVDSGTNHVGPKFVARGGPGDAGLHQIEVYNTLGQLSAWIDEQGNARFRNIIQDGDTIQAGVDIIQNSLIVDGYAILGENSSLDFTIVNGTLTVNNATTLNGNLVVTGVNATLGTGAGSLAANYSSSTFSGDVVVNGTLSVAGLTNLGDSLGDPLQISGSTVITGDATVFGTLRAYGNVEIGDNPAQDTLYIKVLTYDVIASNAQFHSNLQVDGYLNVDGNLTAAGNLTAHGSTFYFGPLSGIGSTFVVNTTAAQFNGGLVVSDSAQFNSDVDIGGNLSVTGAVFFASGSYTGILTIGGGFQNNTYNPFVIDHGGITLDNNGNVSLDGKLTVKGPIDPISLEINTIPSVVTPLKINNLPDGSGTNIFTVDGYGNTVIGSVGGQGDLTVRRNTAVTGNLIVDGDNIQLGSGTGTFTVNMGTVDIGGEVTFTGTTSGLAASNVTYVPIPMSTITQLTVQGALEEVSTILDSFSTGLTVAANAGDAFAPDTSYLVRWAVSGEDPGALYKATAQIASNKKYLAVGIFSSPVSVSAGDSITVSVGGSHTLAANDTLFNAADIGKEVFLRNTGSFSITPPTTVGDAQFRVGVVQDVDKIFIDLKQLSTVVPQPIYDERLQFPSGLSSGTDITLPNNSRNGGAAQLYDAAEGRLTIYQNQTLKFQGIDWIPGTSSTSQIKFNYTLPLHAEVHFRIEPIGSGTLTAAGSGDGYGLQESYDLGNTINVTSGSPFTINGPPSQKLFVVNGDITVTGVIDPIAIQFTPQSTNPLPGSMRGLWISDDDQLILALNDDDHQNISQVITDVQTGTATTVITREFMNTTGLAISSNIPVYSPADGYIAPADGADSEKFRVLGITVEAIGHMASGLVAITGTLENVTGLTHNRYAYLGSTVGSITDIGPTLGGPYGSGFQVIRLGVVEGNKIHLQIQHMGTL